MNTLETQTGYTTQTIPSYEVATMMNKDHWEVLRMLEGYEPQKGSKSRRVIGIIPILTNHNIVVSDYFIKGTYKDSTGKENKYYECTKLGCDMLANKLTGEKGIIFTARYVKQFNDMEQYIKNQIQLTQKERLQLQILNGNDTEKLGALKEYEIIITQPLNETIEKQNEAIQGLLPKADYFDALVERKLLTSIRDTAKELGIKEKLFVNWLFKKNLCYRDKKGKIRPYANKMKYFELKEFNKKNGYNGSQTMIKPEGRAAFRLLLEKDGLI